MLERVPSDEELTALVGPPLGAVWRELCAAIDARYRMDRLWNSGGKAWVYEYKYRRGGKTLCALYARERWVGLLVIFGGEEREKFEQVRESFAEEIRRAYDEAKTYRDGKWVMFLPQDTALVGELARLLAIKRRPDRA